MQFDKGGGPRNGKTTCSSCSKWHYGECLLGIGSCFGCDKDGHKVTNCPNISFRGREAKQVASNVLKDDVLKEKDHFYALRARGSNPDENGDDDEGKYMHLFLEI